MLLALVTLWVLCARAEPIQYQVAVDPNHPAVVYRLPYSLGTHEGKAAQLDGRLSIDPDHFSTVSGRLFLPITRIVSGNASRDCHMREAMGIRYEGADYPSEHVCQGDEIPQSGKNAVVYPEVAFKVTGARVVGELTEVTGEWTMHGVTQPTTLRLRLTREGAKFRVRGTARLSLKDFGVIVKSAKILFVTISVEDQVELEFDFALNPVA